MQTKPPKYVAVIHTAQHGNHVGGGSSKRVAAMRAMEAMHKADPKRTLWDGVWIEVMHNT